MKHFRSNALSIITRFVAGLGFALATVGLAQADQVTMTNGDRLTGTVLRKNSERLVLDTEYAGEVRLRWTDVATVETDEPVTIMLDDDTTVQTRLGMLGEIESAAPGPELARIRYINPTPEQSGIGYLTQGRAGLSASQTRGNSSNDLFHGDGEWVLRAKTHRITVGGEGNYGHDGGEPSAYNWRASSRFDRFFKPKEFVYAQLALENDRFKDIRLRGIAGGGYGYQLFEDDTGNLSLRGGLGYVDVNHIEAEDEDYTALSWGADFHHQFQLIPATFFHVQEGTWGLSGHRGVMMQTRTGLRLPLAEQLSISAQVNVDWESKPALRREKLDTTLLFGIGYTFR